MNKLIKEIFKSISFSKILLCRYGILIHGGYGVRNLGDDAIQKGILRLLKRKLKCIPIYVLSFDVQRDSTKYKDFNINVLSIKSPFSVLYGLVKCKFVLFGGGGRFGSETGAKKGNKPFEGIFVLILAFISKLLRNKVFFYGIGCTEIKHNPYILRIILNMADYISVRDTISLKKLKSIGVKKKIELVKDPAFNLDISLEKEVSKKIMEENVFLLAPKSKKIIGINLRFLDLWHMVDEQVNISKFNHMFIEKMSELVNRLIEMGYFVLFIPFGRHKYKLLENDLLFAYNLLNKIKNRKSFMILLKEYEPEEIISIMSHLDFFIGMRLHSIIFAHIAKIPFVAIIYDKKVEAFLRDHNKLTYGVYPTDERIVEKILAMIMRLESNKVGYNGS